MTALRTSGFLSVAELTRELGVSDMTVRRDLRRLESDGEVRVVRGGVSLPEGSLQSPRFSDRSAEGAEAKQRIAHAAAELVRPGDTVAVDAGTTAYALAETLPTDFSGCVVTHSVPVIDLMLERPHTRVVGLGGDLFPASRAFVGPMTVDAARRVRARTFFLGAAAVDDRGVYVATDVERPTKLALMDVADTVVLLVDETKFGESAPLRLCPWNDVDTVVVDATPPGRVTDALVRAGVHTLYADHADAVEV